jgi:hypothetical protein
MAGKTAFIYGVIFQKTPVFEIVKYQKLGKP